MPAAAVAAIQASAASRRPLRRALFIASATVYAESKGLADMRKHVRSLGDSRAERTGISCANYNV